jgi:hypothetical protein
VDYPKFRSILNRLVLYFKNFFGLEFLQNGKLVTPGAKSIQIETIFFGFAFECEWLNAQVLRGRQLQQLHCKQLVNNLNYNHVQG